MSLTREEQQALHHAADGRSPWHGWDNGYPARSGEAQEAYGARARAITSLRQRQLLDSEGLLTRAGRAMAEELARPVHPGGHP